MSDMSVGVCFASTGGPKILRAARSFIRQEPFLPVHVIIDASSNTWQKEQHRTPLNDLCFRLVENRAHINGTLNHAVRWMQELGYTHAALFHDDLIFSPLRETRNYISNWISRVSKVPILRDASALSFGEIETFVKNPGTTRGLPGHWDAPPAFWDSKDLESEHFWRRLITPDGLPNKFVDFSDFFVDYCPADENLFDRRSRMGPTGQIVNISSWEKVGGFDEHYGLHYDTDFPFSCMVHKLPNIFYLPHSPHLHLHNQSMGYLDPATGPWSQFENAFRAKFGREFHEFCVTEEEKWNANPLHIEG